jgi:hypothetical protein
MKTILMLGTQYSDRELTDKTPILRLQALDDDFLARNLSRGLLAQSMLSVWEPLAEASNGRSFLVTSSLAILEL